MIYMAKRLSREKTGILQRTKDKIANKMDDALDKAYQKAISNPQYLAEWRRLSKVTRNEDIDYTIPQIELETKLCDMRNLKLIRKGRRRDDFLAILSSEAQNLYLHGKDSAGTPYIQLEHPSVLKSMVHKLKARWKKDYHEDMPKEVEDSLMGIIEGETALDDGRA